MPDKNENKIKHLEFIQLTITRMNINSFMIKGWLITLVSAIFVISEKKVGSVYWGVIPFITLLFWALDGFFLSTERKYRGLYNHVRKLSEPEIDYSMDVLAHTKGNGFLRSAASITLLLFYSAIIAASILASTFLV